MIRMSTLDRKTYILDEEGYVMALAPADPHGWDYRKDWRILGFKTRWNARDTVSLADALAGAPTGQGWVVDWDHGIRRIWTSPNTRRLWTLHRTEGTP